MLRADPSHPTMRAVALGGSLVNPNISNTPIAMLACAPVRMRCSHHPMRKGMRPHAGLAVLGTAWSSRLLPGGALHDARHAWHRLVALTPCWWRAARCPPVLGHRLVILTPCWKCAAQCPPLTCALTDSLPGRLSAAASAPAAPQV